MTKALVVLDMQVSLIEDATPNPDEIMSAVYDLVDRARSSGAPVLWVTDTRVKPDAGLHPAFKPRPGEAHITTDAQNAFAETTLAGELGGLGVDEIVVCGMQSDAAITQTVLAAPKLGFPVTLVADAHTTHDDAGHFSDVVAFTNRDLAARDEVSVCTASSVSFT